MHTDCLCLRQRPYPRHIHIPADAHTSPSHTPIIVAFPMHAPSHKSPRESSTPRGSSSVSSQIPPMFRAAETHQVHGCVSSSPRVHLGDRHLDVVPGGKTAGRCTTVSGEGCTYPGCGAYGVIEPKNKWVCRYDELCVFGQTQTRLIEAEWKVC